MALPTLHGTGRCTGDPEMRFAQSGTAVCTVNLAFNSRKRDEQGNWVDGDTMFIRGTAFQQLAEDMAESLEKGTEVVVSGRVKLDQWEDKETGNKRSAPSLLIDAIGPNLRSATARVSKVERSGSSGDAWNSAPSANGGGAFSDDPPF